MSQVRHGSPIVESDCGPLDPLKRNRTTVRSQVTVLEVVRLDGTADASGTPAAGVSARPASATAGQASVTVPFGNGTEPQRAATPLSLNGYRSVER